MTVFTILQNFIAIRQKEPCLRRKYVDFQKMLSDPCLNITKYVLLPDRLMKKKAIINPKNSGMECFKCSVIASMKWEEIDRDHQ